MLPWERYQLPNKPSRSSPHSIVWQPWVLGVQDQQHTADVVNSSTIGKDHKDRQCDRLCLKETWWTMAALAGQGRETQSPAKNKEHEEEWGPLQGLIR